MSSAHNKKLQAAVVEAPVCFACESTNAHLFLTDDSRKATLYRCKDCDYIFMHPMPTREMIKEIYQDCYDGASTGYFKKVDSKMRRARRRGRVMKKYAKAPQGSRFLDVGCNAGFMVEAMRELGFESYGIDMDNISIDYAKKHYPQNTFYCGLAEDYAADKLFDVIYSADVIEHVYDPNLFVANIARLIKKDGLLMIATPDGGHWKTPINDFKSWSHYCPPDHCTYFNKKAMRAILERHGFEVIKFPFVWKETLKVLARKK